MKTTMWKRPQWETERHLQLENPLVTAEMRPYPETNVGAVYKLRRIKVG